MENGGGSFNWLQNSFVWNLSVFVKPYLKFKVGDSLFGLSNFPRVVMFVFGKLNGVL